MIRDSREVVWLAFRLFGLRRVVEAVTTRVENLDFILSQIGKLKNDLAEFRLERLGSQLGNRTVKSTGPVGGFL
jgi:hypothetical protein